MECPEAGAVGSYQLLASISDNNQLDLAGDDV
jgi:hypothetical protein